MLLTKKHSLLLPLVVFLVACTGRTSKLNPDNLITNSAGLATGVRLSAKEAERAGIRFGAVVTEEHQRILLCRGNLVAATDNRSIQVAPVGGRIASVHCHAGQYLHEGSVIACIESSDLIRLQQEYLEMKNQQEYLHDEFTRQGELAVENATSLKKMQLAKRDYQSVELKIKALQLQLEILGINPDSLNRNGISPVIPILMPESGTISRVLMTRGVVKNQGDLLIEINKTSNLAARLKVPEIYSNRLKRGLAVDIMVASDSLTPIHLKISSVAHEIDPADQCAVVYANMPGIGYIPGMSVAARLNLGADSMNLVPSNSLLAENSRYYLFVKKSGIIRKVPIQKGSKFEGLCEIEYTVNARTDSLVVEGVGFLNKYFTP